MVRVSRCQLVSTVKTQRSSVLLPAVDTRIKVFGRVQDMSYLCQSRRVCANGCHLENPQHFGPITKTFIEQNMVKAIKTFES